MRRTKLFILGISILLLSSCAGVYNLNNVNLAQCYNPQNKTNSVETSVWHLNDSISTLNIRFNQSDLTDETVNGYVLNYEVYDSKESKRVINSDAENKNIYITDSNLLKNNTINCPTIILNKLLNKLYLLKLNINDLDKKKLAEFYIQIDKINAFNRQNFQVKDEEGNIIYRNYLNYNEPFKITYNNKNCKFLYVKYYKLKNSIALPPYSEEVQKAIKFIPDSIYKINLTNNESNLFSFNNEGMYHFQADTTNNDGLTLFHFNSDFPFIRTPIGTLHPLRYLSTNKEYAELNQNLDYKNAVDNFWLNIAGNQDRAVSLIKQYYNAVKDANRFFTSYFEGWRTDRGMIYIVYGPPATVYRSLNNEIWIYGMPGNILSLRFVFDKIDNPFTDNDFVLRRDPGLKASWFDAVGLWRR